MKLDEKALKAARKAFNSTYTTADGPLKGAICAYLASAPPAPEVAGLAAWLREEAPWAVQHLHKRIGPDEHQFDAAKALIEKTCQAADLITAQAARIANLEALVFEAFCEGFQEGKDGGWVCGAEGEPWKTSYARAALAGGQAPPTEGT